MSAARTDGSRFAASGLLPARILRSGFVRNASVMLAGTTLGQAIGVAFAPVLTRVYSAEEFGYLSVYTAVLGILGMTAALGLDLAIPLAASEFELANLLAGAGVAVVVTSTLVGITMWLMPASLLAAYWPGAMASQRYLLPLGLVCLGAYYAMVAAATNVGRFGDIAQTRITQGIGGPLSQIVLGVLGGGKTGLTIGFVIGQSSGVFLLLKRAVLDRPQLRSAISWRGMTTVVARYRHFPLVASWTRVIDMAGSGTVLYLLLAAYWPGDVVGYMFLAERVIARPLLMVSTSLLQVFAGEAGRAVRDDPVALGRRFWQVVPGQFLFALIWILPVNMLANRFVAPLFGAPWAAAVPCLHALSPGFLALTALHPVSTTLQMLNRQALAAWWQIARLTALIIAVIVCWHCGFSAVATLWLCSVVQVAACLGMLATMAACIHRLVRAQYRPPSSEATLDRNPSP